MRSLGKVDRGTVFSILAIILVNVADLVTGQTCGGDLTGEGSLSLSNAINSPYPRNCTWNLAATAGMAVNLQIDTFNTGSFGDILQIYSGDVLVFEYPAVFWTNNLVLSSTAKVVLLILSNLGFEFSASFTSAGPACSQACFFFSCSAWTPNFPQPYPQPFNCTWQLSLSSGPELRSLADFTVVNDGAILGSLALSTTTFDGITTNSTTTDGVPQPPVGIAGADISLFFNGAGCRNGLPAVKHGKALGLYNSAACRKATGFLAGFYSRLTSVSCDANITDQGSFTTPNFPAAYPGSSSCIIVLTASPGLSVSLTFDAFNVSYYDSVRLYSDGVFAGRYSGSYDPFTTVLGSIVTVEFLTEFYDIPRPGGFSASFTSV